MIENIKTLLHDMQGMETSIKGGGISWLAESLLDSQEGFSYVELVGYLELWIV
jgi:hypothetical protein